MWLSDLQEAVLWPRLYSSRLFPFGIVKPWAPFVFHLNPALEFAVVMYVFPHFFFPKLKKKIFFKNFLLPKLCC